MEKHGEVDKWDLQWAIANIISYRQGMGSIYRS